MEEEEGEESVQDLLNGVQLIGRCSIRYEKFPRGISRWRKKPELEETASILKEEWIYRERKSFQIVLSFVNNVYMAANYRCVRISAEGGVRRSLPLVPPKITEWRCIK